MNVWVTALVLLLATSAQAATQDRFVSKLKHPTGKTLVIAEGDFEARSTGSFIIRLYDAAAAPDETAFFTSGLVRAREGVIEKVLLADVNGDQQQDIVVVVRSVGSGNYQSAHAFTITGVDLVFLTAVDGLAADADPVASLQESTKHTG